jgi:hypothetical protein
LKHRWRRPGEKPAGSVQRDLLAASRGKVVADRRADIEQQDRARCRQDIGKARRHRLPLRGFVLANVTRAPCPRQHHDTDDDGQRGDGCGAEWAGSNRGGGEHDDIDRCRRQRRHGQGKGAGNLGVGHRHLLQGPRRLGRAHPPRRGDETAHHGAAVSMHDRGGDIGTGMRRPHTEQ